MASFTEFNFVQRKSNKIIKWKLSILQQNSGGVRHEYTLAPSTCREFQPIRTYNSRSQSVSESNLWANLRLLIVWFRLNTFVSSSAGSRLHVLLISFGRKALLRVYRTTVKSGTYANISCASSRQCLGKISKGRSHWDFSPELRVC